MTDRHGNSLNMFDCVRVLSDENKEYEIVDGGKNYIVIKTGETSFSTVDPKDVEKVDAEISYKYAAQYADGTYYVWRGENSENKTWQLKEATLVNDKNSFEDWKDVKTVRVMAHFKIIS